jgi:hypothetical protein
MPRPYNKNRATRDFIRWSPEIILELILKLGAGNLKLGKRTLRELLYTNSKTINNWLIPREKFRLAKPSRMGLNYVAERIKFKPKKEGDNNAEKS